MKFLRITCYLLSHRRRRRYCLFLFVFLVLTLFPSTYDWCFEVFSYDDNVKLLQNDVEQLRDETQNNDIKNVHPVFAKYINEPYDINIWNIIHEANKKYHENSNQYLVYSCPFMCGGEDLGFFRSTKI